MVHTPYHSDFTVCWFLYLIRTADNRLYTGITTDVPRRFRQHQAGKGAKALRGKGDLQLAFSHEVGEHSLALRLEYRIKQLTKREKERLVAGEDPSKPCWQGSKRLKWSLYSTWPWTPFEGVIRQTVTWNASALSGQRQRRSKRAAGSKPKRRYKSGSPSVTTAA
jgi:putative endonuclease